VNISKYYENKKPLNMWMVAVCILLTALFYFFSIGFYDIWWLVWIAPLPLFTIALRTNAITTAISGFIAYLLGSFNVLNYISTALPIDNILWGSLTDAVAFAIVITVSRFIIIHGPAWLALFAFPAFWTSYELLSSTNIYSGTFGSIAYSQMLYLPIVQIAAYTGIWGITFLLCLFPSAIACAIYYRRNKIIFYYTLGIAVVLLLVMLSIGFYHLHKQRERTPQTLTVGLIAAPVDETTLKSQNEKIIVKNIQPYLLQIQLLAKRGAQVVVLPEKVIAINDGYKQKIINLFSSVTRKNHIYMVVGIRQYADSKLLNAAWVFTPTGKLLTPYYKWHLVPGTEGDYIAGNQLVTFNINGIKTGVAICKDMDFIYPAGKYGERGTQILFVPAFDFRVDDWVHARIAIMRGIENGYSVARVGQWGLLSVSDASGRVLQTIKTDDQKTVVLLVQTPIGGQLTFYNRVGDWLGWLAIALGAICIFLGIFFRLLQHSQHK
jgi:apolipoprotein N-acyltransferase